MNGSATGRFICRRSARQAATERRWRRAAQQFNELGSVLADADLARDLFARGGAFAVEGADFDGQVAVFRGEPDLELFEWLGGKRNEPKATQAAKVIDAAVEKVIAEAKHLTADLGGKASTTQMGDAIAAAV